MFRCAVPLIKNRLLTLFLLLVSPLFFSTVASAQVACDCNAVFDQHPGNFILNRTSQPCCFQISFGDRLTNPCSSNITKVEYSLEGAPPCLNQTYDVFKSRYPNNLIGSFNPFSQPFPVLGLPILPGEVLYPEAYKICPQNTPGGDYSLCPCALTYFKVNVKITFADGTICERKKDAIMWDGPFNSGCCYELNGVSEEKHLSPEIILSPNPSQDVISATYSQRLDAISKYTIDIVDAQGIIVKSNFQTVGTNNSFSVEVEYLPVGAYLFTLRNEKDVLLCAKQFTIHR